MSFNIRSRTPRWAGQPSTFLLLLNACLLTALLHYWSHWNAYGPQVSVWVGHHSHSHAHDNDDDVRAHFNVHHAAPPPPSPPPPPPPASAADNLPGFCNVCGPEDIFCEKYGKDILARSRGFEGANARLHRVLRAAQSGQHVKIAVLGGSVSRGQGVKHSEIWFNVFGEWWKSQFPNSRLTLQSGAVAATGTGYMSMCFKEHIDEDADIVLTEFAINDQRSDSNAESYEWLLRQLLEMPKQPAVVNLQVFGLGYHQLTTGGDLHTAVAQYYDTPIVSLRNALLPQLFQNATVAPEYFTILNGKPDLKHINNRGHGMLGELLAAYTQRQLCTIAEHDARSKWPRGTADAAKLTLDVNAIPTHRLFQKWGDAPAQKLAPFCSSTRTKNHPLTPSSNDGRWENWTYKAPGGTPKTYIRATEPGARISFAVPVRGGLGRVRVQYLQSATFGLGVIKCWLDEDVAHAKHIDGFWTHDVNLASMAVISTTATVGDHTLTCELTEHSNSPNGGTEFRLIGVDAA
ncbi:hypothetical protein BKA62DRAFT_612217 [Auriculariales sp. MPI-PUGE-AT-0066]|nr:hypothetical protein BKA62DRAFT_612217 [Auriculariales sp. MPI-PUGE-AT-0066]